jgi:DNA-binding NtrC family response regulator
MIGSRLLSIDDDPQILDLIKRVAGDMGYEAEATTSVGSFMTTYVRTQPDVVTVDICMPEVDGIELVRWLGDVGYRQKIIILSGAHPDYADMAKRLGNAMGNLAIDILRKPFRIKQLRQALSADVVSPTPDDAPIRIGKLKPRSATPATRG